MTFVICVLLTDNNHILAIRSHSYPLGFFNGTLDKEKNYFSFFLSLI